MTNDKLWTLILEYSHCKMSEREAILKRIKEIRDAEAHKDSQE